MAETVTIPLSFANEIFGVTEVQDVTFTIPSTSDIAGEVEDSLPGLEEIRTAAREEIDDALADLDIASLDQQTIIDDIVSDLEDALDIDLPDFEQIASEIASAVQEEIGDIGTVQIQGSLFSVEQDFVDLVATALDEADLLDVSEFPTLEELQEPLESLQEDLDGLDVPTLEDIESTINSALTDLLDEEAGGSLITDPETFIDEQIDRLIDGLFDQEALDELDNRLEDD